MKKVSPNTTLSFYERLKNGEKKVIDDIYHLYQYKIFLFSLAYLKDEEEAYDVVQEVFLKLWNKRLSIKQNTNFDALLLTIAKRTVLSLFRKKMTAQKYQEYLTKAAFSNNIGTSEQTDFVFLQQQYEALLPEMPPRRREIFILSRENGLSNKEIAIMKGISEKTVEDHLTKALAFLKKHLLHTAIWAQFFYSLFAE